MLQNFWQSVSLNSLNRAYLISDELAWDVLTLREELIALPARFLLGRKAKIRDLLVGLRAFILEGGKTVDVPIVLLAVNIGKEVLLPLGCRLSFEADLFLALVVFSRLDPTPCVQSFQKRLVRLGFVEGPLGEVIVVGARLRDSFVALFKSRLLRDFFWRWEFGVVGISNLACLACHVIRLRSGTLS